MHRGGHSAHGGKENLGEMRTNLTLNVLLNTHKARLTDGGSLMGFRCFSRISVQVIGWTQSHIDSGKIYRLTGKEMKVWGEKKGRDISSHRPRKTFLNLCPDKLLDGEKINKNPGLI